MASVDRSFLITLLERLGEAVSAGDLELATRPCDGAGITRSLSAGDLRVDLRLVADPLPRVTLELDPPVDARALCAAWGLARPVAVSSDVEQRSWWIRVGGEELPDRYSRRIASESITAGRWKISPRLAARPTGELPGLVSCASPAYDVPTRGGAVRSIEIAPTSHTIRTLEPSHPDVRELLAVMASAHPSWRGSGEGWSVNPAATFVAIYDGVATVAGCALTETGDGATRASQLCVAPGRLGQRLGATLLDTLEAVARDRGSARLRLDSSAFLLGDELPHARWGYAIAPAYAGDADVEVWAEKDLRETPGRSTAHTSP
jgi:GNAT superfamily N-acetyltransferase